MQSRITLFFILVLIGLAIYFGSFRPANKPPTIEVSKTETQNQTLGMEEEKGKETSIDIQNFYAPILLYHHVAATKFQNSYYVSPEIFDQQMLWLKDNGYHVISFDKFYQAATGEGGLPEKPVVITFDDSLLDQYTNAFPILRKYKYPATFFVKLNNVSSRGTTALTFDEIKDLAKNGMTIGSHSMNHDDMAHMNPDTLHYELNQSKKILEQKVGIKIKYFSYPGGVYSQETISATKNAGYLAAVTTRHKVYHSIKNINSLYLTERIHIDNEMPTFIDWVQGKNLH